MNRTIPTWLASTLLLCGVGGWVLLLASRSGEVPYWLSWRIRDHSAIWTLGSLSLVLIGGAALWKRSHSGPDWQPTHPGRRFHTLVIYSRAICPLCDEAHDLIARYQAWLPQIVDVDIDSDEDLADQFGEWVPVVEIDGKVRFKGHISEVLLRRLIEGNLGSPRLTVRS